MFVMLPAPVMFPTIVAEQAVNRNQLLNKVMYTNGFFQ